MIEIPVPPKDLPVPTGIPDKLPEPNLKKGNATEFPIERYRGVTGEDEVPVVSFYEFQKLFASLKVKWSSPKAYKVLPDHNKRSKLTGWGKKDVIIIERLTGLTSNIPRKCPGYIEGDREHTCPCSFIHGNDPTVWEGFPCPNESVKAYQHFVRYIRELDITPRDQVDIQQVIDIVQFHILEDRCSEDIQLSGLFDKKPVVLNMQSKEVHFERKKSVALEIKEGLQKQRMALYETLMSTRKSKAGIEQYKEKFKLEQAKFELQLKQKEQEQEQMKSSLLNDFATIASAITSPLIKHTKQTIKLEEESVEYSQQQPNKELEYIDAEDEVLDLDEEE